MSLVELVFFLAFTLGIIVLIQLEFRVRKLNKKIKSLESKAQ